MKNFNKKGFTLIEVLLVIAIIGILVAIMFISLVEAREMAKVAKAQLEVRSILNAIILFESDTGVWPGHQTPWQTNQTNNNEICADGCSFGLSDPQAGLTGTDGSYLNWDGPYIGQLSLDPWGSEYFFDTDYDIEPGAGSEWAVVVGSYGPDGRERNGYDTGFASDDIIYIVPTEQ